MGHYAASLVYIPVSIFDSDKFSGAKTGVQSEVLGKAGLVGRSRRLIVTELVVAGVENKLYL